MPTAKTSSSQGTTTRTAPGDFSYSGTHTGVNGQTTDVSRTSAFNSSTDTRTVDKTYTNPTTDKSSTVDKTVAYDPSAGTRTVDKTATRSQWQDRCLRPELYEVQ